MRRLVIALAIAGAAVGEPAAAATITYLADLREIMVAGGTQPPSEGGGTVAPSPPFSDFSAGLTYGAAGAFASQFSLLRDHGMAANGLAGGVLDAPAVTSSAGLSRFHVVFEVDAATPWMLSGEIGRAPLLFDENDGRTTVRLSSGGSPLFELALPPGGASTVPLTLPVFATGQLEPGQYELFIEAAANTGSTATPGAASYKLSFAVPEPGTGSLLVTGLLGIVGWRRMRV